MHSVSKLENNDTLQIIFLHCRGTSILSSIGGMWRNVFYRVVSSDLKELEQPFKSISFCILVSILRVFLADSLG